MQRINKTRDEKPNDKSNINTEYEAEKKTPNKSIRLKNTRKILSSPKHRTRKEKKKDETNNFGSG